MASSQKKCIIEIGCPPGGPRPKEVFVSIINRTLENGNNLTDKMKNTLQEWKTRAEEGSGRFGDFEWRVPHELSDEEFQIMKDEYWIEMTRMFTSHVIRYGFIGPASL